MPRVRKSAVQLDRPPGADREPYRNRVVPGSKRCGRKECGKVKPVTEFHKNRWYKDGLERWCKTCRRVVEAARVRVYTPEQRARRAARRAEKRAADPLYKAQQAAYRKSRWGRMVRARAAARAALRHATTEKRRAQAAALVAAWDREIARAAGGTLPAEPPGTRAARQARAATRSAAS